MNREILETTASALVAEGKGILAADESLPTIKKRLNSIGVESTEENRRAYRGLLFSTEGLEKFISGVIMFDESMRQETREKIPFPELLRKRGIIPGIKVDGGAKDMSGFPGEKVTEGLDGLRGRLPEYRKLGASFAKWRAVIAIGDHIPTQTCIRANTHALARFAAISQEAGLVPIVEPEVLINGSHTIERCEEVTAALWKDLVSLLHDQRVLLEGMLLKASMVISGKECPKQASVEKVAHTTVRLLRRHIPAAVPGIVFLSGGQSPILATEHLNAMNMMEKQPWQLGFSYARALQEPVLHLWKGDPANTAAAQQALYHRASCNSAARRGTYSQKMEKGMGMTGAA